MNVEEDRSGPRSDSLGGSVSSFSEICSDDQVGLIFFYALVSVILFPRFFDYTHPWKIEIPHFRNFFFELEYTKIVPQSCTITRNFF